MGGKRQDPSRTPGKRCLIPTKHERKVASHFSTELLFRRMSISGIELNIGVYLTDFTVFCFRAES